MRVGWAEAPKKAIEAVSHPPRSKFPYEKNDERYTERGARERSLWTAPPRARPPDAAAAVSP